MDFLFVLIELFFASLDVTAEQGVARILHWGPQKLSAEGARIEAPKAPKGLWFGEGVSPPQTTGGSELWGVVSSPTAAGSGADLRQPTHFWHI